MRTKKAESETRRNWLQLQLSPDVEQDRTWPDWPGIGGVEGHFVH
jgi:hypothetical protein